MTFFDAEKIKFEQALKDAEKRFKNPTVAFNLVVWNSLIKLSAELEKIRTSPLDWCFKCGDDTLSDVDGACEKCGLSRPHVETKRGKPWA